MYIRMERDREVCILGWWGERDREVCILGWREEIESGVY